MTAADIDWEYAHGVLREWEAEAKACRAEIRHLRAKIEQMDGYLAQEQRRTNLLQAEIEHRTKVLQAEIEQLRTAREERK